MAVTKTSGGRIGSRIALTLEATAAVANGDLVHITGDYECRKADGTKPVLGYVVSIRKDVPAAGGNRVTTVPGEVAVEAFGYAVKVHKAADAVAAGAEVRVQADGRVDDTGTNPIVGIALNAAAAADDEIDVLCR